MGSVTCVPRTLSSFFKSGVKRVQKVILIYCNFKNYILLNLFKENSKHSVWLLQAFLISFLSVILPLRPSNFKTSSVRFNFLYGGSRYIIIILILICIKLLNSMDTQKHGNSEKLSIKTKKAVFFNCWYTCNSKKAC